MSRMTAPVLLVGSVPGVNSEQVMQTCGQELGDLAGFTSDGEVGLREEFIQGMALANLYGHPDLEILKRPSSGWRPKGYQDLWSFRIKPGVDKLRITRLLYATDAIKSYSEFKALKARGDIPRHYRFMVALPMVDTAASTFITTESEYRILADAFTEALRREVALILESIPPEELVIQWDMPLETLAVATYGVSNIHQAWLHSEPPMERCMRDLALLSKDIPDETLLGLHFCYGDLGNRHVVEPTDLGASTALANAAVERVGRPVDYVHAPVPIDRSDDAYFAPLQGLKLDGGRMYLGLIHDRDGLDDNLRRIEVARRYLKDFGISTECGFGRRPRETILPLLKWHATIASAAGLA